MTTLSIETTLAADALEASVDDWERNDEHSDTYVHEDGTVTVVLRETYVESWMSPRDAGTSLATLVNLSDRYVDLDEPDAGIAEAVERWGAEDELTARYVAMMRPDIAHWEGRWEVSGYSQGDWQYGYGYVTREALAEAGYSSDAETLNGTLKMRARTLVDAEVESYERYFRGDVFWAVHLSVGEPVVTYGEHGAYVSGYDIAEESVGGFLGWGDDERWIAAEMSGSPLV